MSPEARLELIALLARDEAWKAIVHIGRTLLDEYYPAHIFNGSSGDGGPNCIVALREALALFDERINGSTDNSLQLSKTIDVLGLSTQAYNALDFAGYKTLGDLVKCERYDVLRLPNFGKLSLKMLENALLRYGLSLRR
jgi:hypothetical protein